MTYHSKHRALLALVLAVLMIFGASGTAAAQEISVKATGQPARATVEVGTVDELLAALAPNTTIVLKEGEYDLATASDYGVEYGPEYYGWELVLGGAQLNVYNLNGLTLVGQGETSIVTRPRYAEVLSFIDCSNVRLEGLTLGHTQSPDGCVGGVLSLNTCEDVSLENCRLFGCGVMGVTATACKSVTLRNSQIDSCSNGAVYASTCRDMRLEDCQVFNCGLSGGGPGYDLFAADHCKGFALVNCEITGNQVMTLLSSNWSDQVVMLGCRVEMNGFLGSVFQLQGRGITVDKCSFRLEDSERYYPQDSGTFALNPAGKELTRVDLDHMELLRAEYAGPVLAETTQVERTEQPDGRFEVHAATVDELLAAIAPNTTIVLDEGEYDLSAATEYGGAGSDWYYWDYDFDGFSLKLVGVCGLTIEGAGMGKTVVTAEPRYAAVFRFQGCEDLTLRGITAGHSDAPGYCTGNVLDFDGCWNVTLDDCGLYGCGVLGIYATDCYVFTVRSSEIYECTNGAAEFFGCAEVSFEGCSIHDCDFNSICLYSCVMTWDGQLVQDGIQEFEGREYLGEMRYY